MYRDNEETLESMKSIGWKKSANQELCRLRESYNGKIIESENILESIIWTSLHLGLLNFKEGIIDRLINMRSLEHLNGFKKNKGVIGLC